MRVLSELYVSARLAEERQKTPPWTEYGRALRFLQGEPMEYEELTAAVQVKAGEVVAEAVRDAWTARLEDGTPDMRGRALPGVAEAWHARGMLASHGLGDGWAAETAAITAAMALMGTRSPTGAGLGG